MEMEKACVACGMELPPTATTTTNGSKNEENAKAVKSFLASLHSDPRFTSSSPAEHVDK